MKRKFFKKSSSGFMMVEVLVVVFILTISVLAAMSVAEKSIVLARQATHTSQASFLLEEGAEVVRIIRDNNWSNISSLVSGTNYYPTFSGGTWILSASSNTVGIFVRTITVTDVKRDNTTKDISSVGTDDPKTKLVTVNVSWLESGQTITKTLQFYIMDIFS